MLNTVAEKGLVVDCVLTLYSSVSLTLSRYNGTIKALIHVY